MSRGNKILLGVLIGAVVLGSLGAFLAPWLLGVAGVTIGHTITQAIAVNAATLSIPTWAPGVIPAVFANLQTGITVLSGLIGGIAGEMIGATSSKAEGYRASELDARLPSVSPITNQRAAGYAPSLDIDGQETRKSFVQRYEQEKLASSQSPLGQSLH